MQNYFWKAKPVGPAKSSEAGESRALMSSHGIKDQVAIVGMGCTPFREHWDKGLDDLLLDATAECFASAGMAKDDVDAYWLGTAQSGMSGITLAAPLKLAGQARHPGGELLRLGQRGAAPGRLRGGLGRLRRGHGRGRREGQGQRLPGPQRLPRPQRRHRPLADRGGHVQPGGAGLRPALRRRRGRAQAGAGPHRLEEPPQRGPQPPGPVPQGDGPRGHLQRPGGGRPPGRVRLRRGGRRLGRGHRGAGRGRPPLHRQAALHQGAVVRGRQRLRA